MRWRVLADGLLGTDWVVTGAGSSIDRGELREARIIG